MQGAIVSSQGAQTQARIDEYVSERHLSLVTKALQPHQPLAVCQPVMFHGGWACMH